AQRASVVFGSDVGGAGVGAGAGVDPAGVEHQLVAGVADTGQVGAGADAGGEGDAVAAGAQAGQGRPGGGADQVGGVPNHGKRPARLAAVHGQVERPVGQPAALILGLHVHPVSGQVPAGGERLQRLGEG